MATVDYTLLLDFPTLKVILWEALTTTNADGQWFEFSGYYPDKNVQVIGTPGTGLDLDIEGTNEPTPANPCLLHDATEDDLTFVTADVPKIKQVLECPIHIRPKIQGGDGNTDVDVLLVVRK